VTGTTRSADKAGALRSLGAEPVVVDVFDAVALAPVVKDARPQAIIHQLTDLGFAPGTPQYEEGLARNARLRIEGTRNLVDAARVANVTRMVAQSIGFFVYAPGQGPRVESDPVSTDAAFAGVIKGAVSLEQDVLSLPQGVVLRYGFFYGPGTWSPEATQKPAIHIDAAGQATVRALDNAKHGIYNVAEDDAGLSSEKAKREFGFDASFRIKA
jgi:nucleoside-diphosphate-sugar epimerase